MAADTATAPGARNETGSSVAALLLFIATAGLALSFGGLYGDGVWHQSRPFEEFWSPPHLVLYTGLALVLLINIAIFYPPFREAFRALSRYDGGRGSKNPALRSLRSLRAGSSGSPFRADHLSWLVATAVYLACYGALFGLHPAGVALAFAGGWLAAFLGRGLAGVVAEPSPRAMGWTFLGMGLIFPVALSSLDFYLRWPLLR